jgi:hypothetical protein
MDRAKSRRKPGQEQRASEAHVPPSNMSAPPLVWQAVWVDACSSLSARRVRVSPAPSPIAPLAPSPSLKLDGALGGEGPSPRHHVPQLQRAKRPQTFQVQPLSPSLHIKQPWVRQSCIARSKGTATPR